MHSPHTLKSRPTVRREGQPNPRTVRRRKRRGHQRGGSVGVLAPVILEDQAAHRDGAQRTPDDEQPPREHGDGEDHGAQRGRAPQRPPGVRREEPELTGAVGDLGVAAILRAGVHVLGVEAQVERDHAREQEGHGQRRGPGPVTSVRTCRGREPVAGGDHREKDRDGCESPSLSLHPRPPSWSSSWRAPSASPRPSMLGASAKRPSRAAGLSSSSIAAISG